MTIDRRDLKLYLVAVLSLTYVVAWWALAKPAPAPATAAAPAVAPAQPQARAQAPVRAAAPPRHRRTIRTRSS
jgi:hypothetical protein